MRKFDFLWMLKRNRGQPTLVCLSIQQTADEIRDLYNIVQNCVILYVNTIFLII
jgi:homospermidine synthase